VAATEKLHETILQAFLKAFRGTVHLSRFYETFGNIKKELAPLNYGVCESPPFKFTGLANFSLFMFVAIGFITCAFNRCLGKLVQSELRGFNAQIF